MINRMLCALRWLPAIALTLLPTAGFCAGLTLTATGTSDGFALSTFATMDPGNTGCCGGPFGIAVASNGNIIVANNGNGTNYVFTDVDGQTTGTAVAIAPSGAGTTAYATVGGQAYGNYGGQFVQFNANGTVNHVLSDVSPSPYLGMWGDPVSGDIYATSGVGIIKINPTANGGLGSYTVIVPGILPDGLSVSPDGSTIYVELFGQLYAYNSTTGAFIFSNSNFGTLGGLDGTGVITSTNSLNGDIIENFNGNGSTTGGIGLLDPSTDIFTVIATGGTRGDYVSPDTTNGTLFLDYSDTVERLSCGPNCSIGSVGPPSTVPEPGSFMLLGTGMTFAVSFARRRLARP